MDDDLAPNLRRLGLRKKRPAFNGCSSFMINPQVTPYLTQQAPLRCRMSVHRSFPTRLLTRFVVRLSPGTVM